MRSNKLNINDLTVDNRNANKGNDTGKALLKTSLQKYGAGRSILIDKHGKVIAGNHTVKEAALQGIEDVIVVQTTGRELVAVQRIDIEKDSKEGHELAIADNRVAQANIVFDLDLIRELHDEFDLDLGDIGIDLADGGPSFADEAEPDAAESMETNYGAGNGNRDYQPNVFPLAVVLTKAQKLDWEHFKKLHKFKTDTDCFLAVFKISKETYDL